MSERYVHEAHLVLVCAETRDALQYALARLNGMGSAPRVAVFTKSDQPRASDDVHGDARAVDGAVSLVQVSAATREGLDGLLAEVHRVLARSVGDVDSELPIVTRARHRVALEEARAELAHFLTLWETRRVPVSVAAIHVRSATHALDDLIGSVDVEDVLERVFRTFCVGK